MTNKLTGTLQLIACLILTGATQPAPCQTIEIKMGTVVPEGSVWHEVIQTMAQQWRQISDGKVEMRIYPGGVLGGEVDMLRKVRVGQLQAVALSAVGLSHVDRSASCMGVPMLIESYEELDHVRAEVAPMIEERFRENGYVVLMWSDAGWVHFFTKKPARTLDDIREMKLWIGAGDAEAEQLYKEFGINPVPLPMTDMLTSLETGIIDAIQVPPLFALVDQSFALTKNMVDVKWAPLVAATVVRRRDWERIPAELRPRLLDDGRSPWQPVLGVLPALRRRRSAA